jgi:hypothetical protein
VKLLVGIVEEGKELIDKENNVSLVLGLEGVSKIFMVARMREFKAIKSYE